MCLNGTGILNSWLRREFFPDESYETMNSGASLIPWEQKGYFVIRLEMELNEFWKIKTPVDISRVWILTVITNITWPGPPRKELCFPLFMELKSCRKWDFRLTVSGLVMPICF